MKTMGQIVREWRKAKGLSAVELASRVGESRQNIENFEAVPHSPPSGHF